MKNRPQTSAHTDSASVTASQTTPIPDQKPCGYMQMSSESLGNVQVPAAKKSAWKAANRPLKSMSAHEARMTNSAITAPPAQASGLPKARGPQVRSTTSRQNTVSTTTPKSAGSTRCTTLFTSSRCAIASGVSVYASGAAASSSTVAPA